MRAWLTKWIRRTALLLVVIIVGLLAFRTDDTQRGPPLEPWHTYSRTSCQPKLSITPIGRIISRPKTRFSRM